MAEKNKEILARLKIQGRNYLIKDQEDYVKQLSEKIDANAYQKCLQKLEETTISERKYREAMNSKQLELKVQRCKVNSPDIQSLKENIQLKSLKVKNELQRERRHVADLLATLGVEPPED